LNDRWQSFPLDQDLPFNVRNLVKLSKAVDPWVSTLAVDTDSRGELRIWGLIDQSVHYSRFVMNETDTGSEMPGIFQAAIQGVGDIAAYKSYIFLGSLRQDTLVTKELGVLENGPVHEKLQAPIKRFRNRIAKQVGSDQYRSRGHWDRSLEALWISALCRILISIRRYAHGGAILLTDSHVGLRPKYSLQYPRLAESLVREGVLLVQSTAWSDVIHEEFLEPHADELPRAFIWTNL
jgi:hypothetical protein